MDEDKAGARASRDTTSPVPALAVSGVIGAILIAEGFQLGQRPADGPARGLVTVLTTLLSVFLGMFVSRGYTRRKAPRDPWAIPPPGAPSDELRPPSLVETLLRAIGFALVATVIVALALRLIVWSGGFEHILGGVAVGALAWTPIVVLLVHLHHRSGRSRGGSLLRACDERAVWFTLSAVAVLGSTALTFMPENAHLAGRTVSQALGVLALLLLPWFAGRNGVALLRAWRLARTAATLKRTTELTSELEVLDLGIGDEMFEERAGGSAYRTAPATRVVLGSPSATLRLVRRDAAALGILACAGLAIAAARGLSS